MDKGRLLIQNKICDIQGRLFQLSGKEDIDSERFAKVFMTSSVARDLDSTYNRMQWAGEEYLLAEVIDIAGSKFDTVKSVFSKEELYWIGSTYRKWHYHTGESSKCIYKTATIKIMRTAYKECYDYPIEDIVMMIKSKK